MKKCVVLFILLFVLPVGIFAQDYKDIIYLKDGSIVKGIISENILDRYVVVKTSFGEKLEIYVADIEIIEKEKFPSEMPTPKDQLILANGVKLSGVILKYIPYDYLEFLTGEGEVVIVDMPDVEEVTKERQYSGVMDSSKSGYSLSKNENEVKFSLVPKGRYKGFYNLAILDERRFRIGTENEDTEVKFEISTSHGVMFNPYLFLGIGFSFHYYLSDDEEDVLDYESLELPLYLHLRSHIINKKTAPFVDLRFGCFVEGIRCLYFVPSVGCRFSAGERMGFWLGFGYSMNRINKSVYDYPARSGSLSFQLGVDF